jgi:hypothetical protein
VTVNPAAMPIGAFKVSEIRMVAGSTPSASNARAAL